jgi:hypothetical protein
VWTSVTNRAVGYEITATAMDLEVWVVGETKTGFPPLQQEGWTDGTAIGGKFGYRMPSYGAQGRDYRYDKAAWTRCEAGATVAIPGSGGPSPPRRSSSLCSQGLEPCAGPRALTVPRMAGGKVDIFVRPAQQ